MNDNKSEIVRGVDCGVKTCKYHGSGDRCHAESIKVESPSSCCSSETYCATFKKGSDSSLF